MKIRITCIVGMSLLVAAACGDSGGGTGGATSDTSSTGDATTSATSGPSTITTTSDGSATSGQTDGATVTGSPTSDPTGATSTSTTQGGSATEAGSSSVGSSSDGSSSVGSSSDGSSGGGGSSGGVVDCAQLGPMQCMNNNSCKAIMGSKINLQKMCLGKPAFLACVDAMACGDAITIACPMGTTEPWQFPDTCIPPDYMSCDGMPVDGLCK